MTNKEFTDKIKQGLDNIKAQCKITNIAFTEGTVFQNAAIREARFEQNLREDYKRQTTFAKDFAIAERFGKNAVLDTFKRSVHNFRDNKEYFAEMILVTNFLCWYFNFHKQDDWSKLYAELYYLSRDLYFEYLGSNQEAMDYYYNYVD